jgi:hypothetical protein
MRFRPRQPSIVELIAEWDGGPPPELPDEPPDDGHTVRWGAGALDGVAGRHGGGTTEPVRAAVLAELIEHAAGGADDARRVLYEAARGEGIVFALDEALEALARAGVSAEPVAELGRALAREARHREPLKLAISLVGSAGDERDVELLETLARHDEFSLVAGIALASVLDDPVRAWWRVGCLATGWGRVEAVDRLAGMEPQLTADVRAWLLRSGCLTADIPEYVAFACATAGRLEEAVTGLVDDELLDGACAILSALVTGGPAQDMQDYDPARDVAAAVLDLLDGRAPNLVRLWAVVDLRNWAEDYEQHVAIAARCGRLLDRPEARRFVASRLQRPGDVLRVWGVAEAMGLDPWEAGWRHLHSAREPSGLYLRLSRTREAGRWARLVAFAERELPLDLLATGPEDRLLPGDPHREASLCLGFLVQEMGGDRWSERIIAAALMHPVILTRNGAIRALAQTPREQWGTAVEAALRRLVATEPREDVRRRAVEQLARLPA